MNVIVKCTRMSFSHKARRIRCGKDEISLCYFRRTEIPILIILVNFFAVFSTLWKPQNTTDSYTYDTHTLHTSTAYLHFIPLPLRTKRAKAARRNRRKRRCCCGAKGGRPDTPTSTSETSPVRRCSLCITSVSILRGAGPDLTHSFLSLERLSESTSTHTKIGETANGWLEKFWDRRRRMVKVRRGAFHFKCQEEYISIFFMRRPFDIQWRTASVAFRVSL